MPRPIPVERRSYQKRVLPSGFPEVDSDKFNPSDYFLDQYYLHGFISDVLHKALNIPLVYAGLAVSNVGDNLQITAGSALCHYQEDDLIPHNNDGSPLTTRTAENLIAFAFSALSSFAIAGSGAIGDGSTNNSIRARAVWQDDETRSYQSNPLDTYAFLRILKLEFIINPVTPADYPLDLGTFVCTLTGPTVSGFTYSSTTRSPNFSFDFEQAPKSSVAATLPEHLVRFGDLSIGFSVATETANGGPYYAPVYFTDTAQKQRQLRCTAATPVTFGGFANGFAGRVLLVSRLDGDVTLLHNAGPAAAGDRIWSPTGSDIVLGSKQSALLIYTLIGAEYFWLAVSTGGGGGSTGTLVSTAVNYAALSSDDCIIATAACTITFPPAFGNTNRRITVKSKAPTGVVNIVSTGGYALEGLLTFPITVSGDAYTFVSDNTTWHAI